MIAGLLKKIGGAQKFEAYELASDPQVVAIVD